MRHIAGSAAMLFAAAIWFTSSTSSGETENCKRCVVASSEASGPQSEAFATDASSQLALPKADFLKAAFLKADFAGVSREIPVSYQVDENVMPSPDICAMLVETARANELPPSFLVRLIWQESRFDPTSVSRAGALGIAQFMPETASEVGLTDPYDPAEALPASGRLLKRLHREFGNLGLAAGAYNAGSGRIRNWLANRQSLPQETRNYIRIVTGHPAETWTREDSVLSFPTRFPKETPCNELNATTENEDGQFLTVALTSEMSGLLRNARAEMLAASRKRKSSKVRRSRGTDSVASSHRHPKRLIAKALKVSRPLRVASAR